MAEPYKQRENVPVVGMRLPPLILGMKPISAARLLWVVDNRAGWNLG